VICPASIPRPAWDSGILCGERCSVSGLVREAVDHFLDRRKSGSAHDKAPHLCGCLEMPPDAGTSDDYLKQYARD
jgi:hypothetical protein